MDGECRWEAEGSWKKWRERKLFAACKINENIFNIKTTHTKEKGKLILKFFKHSYTQCRLETDLKHSVNNENYTNSENSALGYFHIKSISRGYSFRSPLFMSSLHKCILIQERNEQFE